MTFKRKVLSALKKDELLEVGAGAGARCDGPVDGG
jgi:hypothetical protein